MDNITLESIDKEINYSDKYADFMPEVDKQFSAVISDYEKKLIKERQVKNINENTFNILNDPEIDYKNRCKMVIEQYVRCIQSKVNNFEQSMEENIERLESFISNNVDGISEAVYNNKSADFGFSIASKNFVSNENSIGSKINLNIDIIIKSMSMELEEQAQKKISQLYLHEFEKQLNVSSSVDIDGHYVGNWIRFLDEASENQTYQPRRKNIAVEVNSNTSEEVLDISKSSQKINVVQLFNSIEVLNDVTSNNNEKILNSISDLALILIRMHRYNQIEKDFSDFNERSFAGMKIKEPVDMLTVQCKTHAKLVKFKDKLEKSGLRCDFSLLNQYISNKETDIRNTFSKINMFKDFRRVENLFADQIQDKSINHIFIENGVRAELNPHKHQVSKGIVQRLQEKINQKISKNKLKNE